MPHGIQKLTPNLGTERPHLGACAKCIRGRSLIIGVTVEPTCQLQGRSLVSTREHKKGEVKAVLP